ncbi:MAG: hypothetical protein J5590_08965 [Clostridia bacterium]|nr:hypothetical protein [Clostridia bacterium]
MRFFRHEKGEFTVEAILVFSISFMALIIVMYIGIVMYQHVHLQSITDRIASRGAMMYATRTTDMSTGAKDIEAFWNPDPYRYIFDGSYKSTAEGEIGSSLQSALGIGNVIKGNSGDSASAKVDLGIFSRKVEITGNRSFNVPFVSVFKINNSMFDLNIKSTAYIMDMPETIRNVDYAADILKQNKAISDAIQVVTDLKTKLENFISKIS